MPRTEMRVYKMAKVFGWTFFDYEAAPARLTDWLLALEGAREEAEAYMHRKNENESSR